MIVTLSAAWPRRKAFALRLTFQVQTRACVNHHNIISLTQIWSCHFQSSKPGRGFQTFSMESLIADILITHGPKLTQIKLGVTVNNVGDCVMLPEKQVISKKKVVISLAVTNYAVRDQIDWIEVSRKHCAIHLFCNYEKGSTGRSLATLVLNCVCLAFDKLNF